MKTRPKQQNMTVSMTIQYAALILLYAINAVCCNKARCVELPNAECPYAECCQAE